jgi:hypothetical protein
MSNPFPNIHDIERRVCRLESMVKDNWVEVFEIHSADDIIAFSEELRKKLALKDSLVVRIGE